MDPSFVAMFMDEARLAARLNHPNVVQTYEVGSDGGAHFIAMEFLEGVPYVRVARLRDRIPPPIAYHMRILVDVLHGLHYAHELRDFDGKPLNVVHRDVSPQNVMLTFAGPVKVLDFGIAKAALAAEQRPDDFKGKLEYMAPEQALLQNVDRRADIFGVGVMLWEALARRRFYERGEDKYRRLVTGEAPDVLSVRPDAPRRLAQICARALARDPDQRYPTALDMAHDIEEWLDSTTQFVSARDVGTYVTEKFASTREKLAVAIEEQLRLLRALPEDAPQNFPLSRIPVTEVPPPDVSEPLVGAGASGAPPAIPSEPHTGSTAFSAWARERQLAAASAPPPQAKPSSAAPLLLAALGVLAAGAIAAGAVFFMRSRADAPSEPVSIASVAAPASAEPGSAPGPSAASAQPAPAPAQIEFTIKASPAQAKIFVDGELQAANPATGHRPRDGAMHVVRVEANGYEPREEQLAFDRSFLVTLELKKQADPAAPPTRAHRRPRPPPPVKGGTAPAAQPGIDTENPYR